MWRVRYEFKAIRGVFIKKRIFHGFQHKPCKIRVLHNNQIHLFSSPKEAEDFYHRLGWENRLILMGQQRFRRFEWTSLMDNNKRYHKVGDWWTSLASFTRATTLIFAYIWKKSIQEVVYVTRIASFFIILITLHLLKLYLYWGWTI